MSQRLKVGREANLKKRKKEVSFTVNQDEVLNDINERAGHKMTKDILVKPLPVEKVMKKIIEQKPTGEKDPSTGMPLLGEPVETIQEVDSSFRKGIVLQIPANYTENVIKVGDIVAFPYKFSIDFDLFKDSMLVKPYDVISICGTIIKVEETPE